MDDSAFLDNLPRFPHATSDDTTVLFLIDQGHFLSHGSQVRSPNITCPGTETVVKMKGVLQVYVYLQTRAYFAPENAL